MNNAGEMIGNKAAPFVRKGMNNPHGNSISI
jgi:hypothetical protein